MKRSVSIALMGTILVSVVGYTLPCTLHCLNAEMTMEMSNNASDVQSPHSESCTHHKTQAPIDAATANALLAQYHLHLLINFSGPSELIKNPLTKTKASANLEHSDYRSWTIAPPVPPPQPLLSV